MKTINENWRDTVTNTTVSHIVCDTLLPVDTNVHRNPLNFDVKAIPGQVIDLKNVRINAKFDVKKFVDGEWKALSAVDKVTLYNGFGFSVFEDVHLLVNGVLVETAQREYGRISYLKNLLFSSEREQKSLATALFYEDTPGYLTTVLKSHVNNRGDYLRSKMITDGECSFDAPIYLDLFRSDAYLPDHASFMLKFYLARTENCLFQEVNGQPLTLRVEIKSATLYVPRCQLNTSIPKSLTVPFETVRVLTYLSPKDTLSFSRSLNTNQIPKKLAVVLLSEAQHRGDVSTHGFEFNPHAVSNVLVTCNGQSHPFIGGMPVDYDAKKWLEPYKALFTQLHAENPLFGIEYFKYGFAIYGFNLTPDHHSQRETKPQFGACELDIQFKTAPTENLMVLVFCYYDGKYIVDKGEIISNVNPKLQ
jgi:hypothetical protein